MNNPIPIDPKVKPQEPRKPVYATVTLTAVVRLDPADFYHKDRQPNSMMLEMEKDLQSSITKRTWLVCEPNHQVQVQLDMTPAQHKKAFEQ